MPPEERAQIGGAGRHRAQKRLGVHHARGVQVGQLGGETVTPGQLIAQPLTDHARGGVALGQRVEQPPLPPHDGRQLGGDGAPPRGAIDLAGAQLGHRHVDGFGDHVGRQGGGQHVEQRTVEHRLPDLEPVAARLEPALVVAEAPVEGHPLAAVRARHGHEGAAALGARRDPGEQVGRLHVGP